MKKNIILIGILILGGFLFTWINNNLEEELHLAERKTNDLKANNIEEKKETKDTNIVMEVEKKDESNTTVSNNKVNNTIQENNNSNVKTEASNNLNSNEITSNKKNEQSLISNTQSQTESDVEIIEIDNYSNIENDSSNPTVTEIAPSENKQISTNKTSNIDSSIITTNEDYFVIEIDNSTFELQTSNNNTNDPKNSNVSINTGNEVKNSTNSTVTNNSTTETPSATNDKATEPDLSVNTNNNTQELSKENTSDKTTTNTTPKEDKTIYSSEHIKLNKTLKYLKYKNSYQLKATLKGIEGTIVWSTSNEKIAKVDQNGKVTATGGGIAIITAIVGKEKTSCKVIAVRNTFKKLNKNPYRTTATIYYNGDEKITYYFRTQGTSTACTSEKLNGKQICTSGFKQWYANHGCGTIATTAVVNAYLGNDKNNLISAAKMRMYYEKEEYNWKCSSSDPYCDKNIFQLTRKRVADVLNNQFNLSATAYVIKSTTGNEKHIERITNALAEGRPVIIFVNAKMAGTTKFTSQNHTLVMVGFADEKGNVLVLDSSHDGFKEDTVAEMVNQYIGRGSSNYRGYIVLNKTKN